MYPFVSFLFSFPSVYFVCICVFFFLWEGNYPWSPLVPFSTYVCQGSNLWFLSKQSAFHRLRCVLKVSGLYLANVGTHIRLPTLAGERPILCWRQSTHTSCTGKGTWDVDVLKVHLFTRYLNWLALGGSTSFHASSPGETSIHKIGWGTHTCGVINLTRQQPLLRANKQR